VVLREAGLILRVLEIFDSLQGEGFWTGTPMTFVRLAGCNAPELGLGCTAWCDTRESWEPKGGREVEVSEVIAQVRLQRLCLTGGEPLLQSEGASALTAEARERGVRVHVETNGTIAPPAPGMMSPPAAALASAPVERPFDWTTVSPKPPDYKVVEGWKGLVDELKFVVDEYLKAATVERVAADYPEAVVSLQPEWGAETAQKAADMVMAHPGWRLSPQMHKYLGIA